MPMETLSEAVERLTAAGYRDDFRAEPGGLRAVGTRCLHDPESLVIEEVVRFEGTSDPGDEAVLFALRCETHGTKGTYVRPSAPPWIPWMQRWSDIRATGGGGESGPPLPLERHGTCSAGTA